ncbi:MAG: efflux RND transporter permease subunit [Microscillaceae bacterium]|nr:efflux RND transporter permease subunit [Microscillaceae bacterium]
MTLTEIAVKRPSLIVVIFAVLTFLGVFSYSQLGYELLPKLNNPFISISVLYPGASPSEVENSVTKKIEDAVASMENIESIRSTSQESYSMVIVELKPGTDVDMGIQDAQRKINRILGELPDDAKAPSLGKINFSEMPIIRLGVAAQLPATELYDLIKQRIQPSLSRLEGVGQITLVGGEEREIRVNLDAHKLEAYRLSVLQVSQAIQNANLDFPTGKIKEEGKQNIIRLAGKFENLKDLQTVVVSNRDQGSPVYLKDVAEIEDTQKEITSITHINRQNAIGLLVVKQTDANAVAVKELVLEEIEKLEKAYRPQNLEFTVAQDATEFTLASADAVMHDLMLAVILVAVVMLLFLHSLRNAFIVMLAIPASLVSTFIVMYLLGFTLNLMTLLALSLVVSILVDDSIVVLENIYRHLEMGKDRRQAALDGRNEIGFTALSITLVDVVVFLPIALTTGLISDLLRQFSLVVVASTLMSLFVSFTVTPLLASRLSRLEKLNRRTISGRVVYAFESFLNRITAQYVGLLRWSLRHKIVVLSITVVLFFSSLMLIAYGFIGSEFVSMGDRGEFIMQVELPKDATIEQTNYVVQKVEDQLYTHPEVTGVFSMIGANSQAFGGLGNVYEAEINVKLVDKTKRKLPAHFFANEVRNELLTKISGAKIKTSPVSVMGTADEAPIQVIFSGSNLDSVLDHAGKVADKVKKIPGTADVELSVEGGNPELKVALNKERMAELGLSTDLVGATLQTAFSGNIDSKYKEGAFDYDINIRLDAFDRDRPEDVSQLTFINTQGEQIRLEQFAEVIPSSGPAILERRSRLAAVTLKSQVVGRPVGTVGEEVQTLIAGAGLPAYINIAYDGDLKLQNDAFGTMGIALLASILFVYLIMVALYDSYVYPFVVLFSIPVAVIGALLALALTMESLNIFSLLGIIMLIGLVGKNAILLVDFANHQKAQGLSTFDALIEAGRERLRPILMTTVAMVIGMLPIALASGAGAEWKNGLAWALIGGLTSSMLLTLVLVPIVYSIADYLLALGGKIFRRKPQAVLEKIA